MHFAIDVSNGMVNYPKSVLGFHAAIGQQGIGIKSRLSGNVLFNEWLNVVFSSGRNDS
jgi:hypothetical protein